MAHVPGSGALLAAGARKMPDSEVKVTPVGSPSDRTAVWDPSQVAPAEQIRLKFSSIGVGVSPGLIR